MKDLLDKFERLQLDKNKIILILAVAAVIVVLDVAFIIGAQFKAIKNISLKVAQLNKDANTLNGDLIAMKQGQAKPKITHKVKKIISESDLPSLVQDIDTLAKNNSIKIIQIKPGWGAGDKSGPVGDFSQVSILLDLNCAYQHLGSFVNDLENAEKFMAVQEMEISPLGNDYLQQKVKLVLKTYVKK